MATADLLLHPVRLRIVQAFLGDRALTTGDLAAELADVPAASLYRHVARLVDAGVLAVVAETRPQARILGYVLLPGSEAAEWRSCRGTTTAYESESRVQRATPRSHS